MLPRIIFIVNRLWSLPICKFMVVLPALCHVLPYSEIPNNSIERNNGTGWKNLPKLIIVQVGIMVQCGKSIERVCHTRKSKNDNIFPRTAAGIRRSRNIVFFSRPCLLPFPVTSDITSNNLKNNRIAFYSLSLQIWSQL